MDKELVLILLATYQGSSYLKEQIESILQQTYENIQIYIRDDLSNDDTPQIISHYAKKFPEKIHVLKSNERLGVIGNFACLMQSGLNQAPYIMLSDQDDVWKKDKVEKTLRVMKAYEVNAPCLVHADLTVVNNQLKIFHLSFWKYSYLKPQGRQSLNRLLVQNVVTGCTVMMNQALLQKALPIPKEILMHDWWLALVAAAFGKIVPIEESLIYYRQHSSNQLGARNFKSLKNFNQQWKTLQGNYLKLFQQGASFYKQFEDELSEGQRNVLKYFLTVPKLPFWKGRWVIIRQKFFKQGFLRNCLLLAFLKAEKG